MNGHQTLVVANFKTGYETDLPAFFINNDAFPVLNNAYTWRGRVKKKRGTSQLGRLQRSVTGQPGSTDAMGNFLGFVNLLLGIGVTANIVPGTFLATVGSVTVTEHNPPDGTLLFNGTPAPSGSFINYASTQLGLVMGTPNANMAIHVAFDYYVGLPVLGFEDFDISGIINSPTSVAFDTTYSYQFNQSTEEFYDVTFYQSSGLPFTWTGENFQQFWSTNYSGAMWVTNAQSGFHFAIIEAFPDITSTTTATITLGGGSPTLAVGDIVYFNEVQGAVATGINGNTGIVTNASSAPTYTITLTSPATVTTFTSGIVLLLTHSVASIGNGLKFYTGDPTTGTAVGWVNFSPPLSNATLPQYLIGADLIVAFKNRLLFFGVTLATSASPGGIYYQNRMVYSQDGTPYYSSLVPINQTFNPMAWFQNVAGFGGFLAVPIPQSIVTAEDNGDVIITGYETKQLKLIFTGDDTFPFYYQTINSELGSQSTFSGVSLDTGTLSLGEYGFGLTTQISAQRIDLVIPDQVYEISYIANGSQRVTAIRDYRNQFIYFSYPPVNRSETNIFNSKTLLYNYIDNTWATFDENYTHYGTFRRSSNKTWATLKYKTWATWTDAWNFGSTAANYPNIVGGNQQGFVMIKDDGTYEDYSQWIQNFDPTTLAVTSPNHCLQSGNFIEITGALGTTNLNGQVFKISVPKGSMNIFFLELNAAQQTNPPTGAYLGVGTYRRMTNISVFTKQFPLNWEGGRQTRIGVQRYLFQNAPPDHDGDPPNQVTVNIFTSQNDNFPSNLPEYGYLPYSNIVLTSPEPGMLLNPFQTSQAQIWHRSSNSLQGDTVQLQFTLSDAQMYINTINSAEIILYALAIDVYPGRVLA